MGTLTGTKIAIYARTSTRKQSLDNQLVPLREYTTRRGAEPVEFTDQASGSSAARESLAILLEAAKRQEFDAVAVVKLARLACSVRQLVDIAAEFESLGIALVVLDQSIDTATPTGRLLFNVLASIGEFERDLIRERIEAGRARARREGQPLGRPPALDRRGAARVKRLRRSGMSVRKVAAMVGCSRMTVVRAERGHR